MCVIVNPLTAVQIEAAAQLRFLHMPLWAASGDALDALRTAMPGFGLDSIRCKVIAVSYIYRAFGPTPADAVVTAAVNKAATAMSAFPGASVATVDAIVNAVEPASGDSYRPFASKFVHFFVPPHGTVPMYDSWTRKRVNYHFRPDDLEYIHGTYADFFAEIATLQAFVTPFPSLRGLDQYLWLAGQYADWTTAPATHRPTELAAVAANPEVQALLAVLCPEMPPTAELL